MNYDIAYKIGFHPWEDAESCPRFSGRLIELAAEEEGGHLPSFGRALDIGTGSGIWGLALARRGWEVTGVDLVAKAVERARDRIATEDVDMRVVLGDVTRLDTAGIGDGYRLVVDTGTFHDFDPDQQIAMGRGIDAITTDAATILLTVWPRRRRPLIRGGQSRGDRGRLSRLGGHRCRAIRLCATQVVERSAPPRRALLPTPSAVRTGVLNGQRARTWPAAATTERAPSPPNPSTSR